MKTCWLNRYSSLQTLHNSKYCFRNSLHPDHDHHDNPLFNVSVQNPLVIDELLTACTETGTQRGVESCICAATAVEMIGVLSFGVRTRLAQPIAQADESWSTARRHFCICMTSSTIVSVTVGIEAGRIDCRSGASGEERNDSCFCNSVQKHAELL